MDAIENELASLRTAGNFRHIPTTFTDNLTDFSSNDYLGLAEDRALREEFLATLNADNFRPTSSASRLLAGHQDEYQALENTLAEHYHRPALLFNSGYHANTGMISALGGASTLFIADKLVHASIIDGLILSRSKFERFRHNDYAHLVKILDRYASQYSRVVIVTESIYSMDGDHADIEQLIDIKKSHDNVMLYVDEAHGVGVSGPHGLGLTMATSAPKAVDIMVGTFGKALASVGAYAITSPTVRDYMINRARSFIFSTSLPPTAALWSRATFIKALTMDAERAHLAELAEILARATHQAEPSHIQPLIIGDAALTVAASQRLKQEGLNVLPIRTPTVPPGTERLRFSLSAALPTPSVLRAVTTIQNVIR
jgi:8-amino-7-oxononanoate synthase